MSTCTKKPFGEPAEDFIADNILTQPDILLSDMPTRYRLTSYYYMQTTTHCTLYTQGRDSHIRTKPMKRITCCVLANFAVAAENIVSLSTIPAFTSKIECGKAIPT